MKVIVVGAGIAGLGAAVYFSRKGHDVTVLEASNRVGGRALTLRRTGGDDRVDMGTQYFHTGYHRALDLIRLARLEPQLNRVAGYTRVFHPGMKHGSWRYNRKTLWYRAAGVAGNLRMGAFMTRTLASYPIRPFVLAARSPADDLPAPGAADNPVVHECISRPLAQVGSLSEPDAMDMSLHHLIRLIYNILFTGYLSLSGGTAALHEALASRLRVRRETPVARLVEEGGHITGVELAGSGEVLTADRVVVATVPPVAWQLLPESLRADGEFLANIRIPAFTLPVYFLDRPLEKNVWSYLMHHLPGRISYLTDAAVKNPGMIPSGNAVIQPWVCYPHSAELAGLDDGEVIDLCTGEIEQVFPGFSSWIEDVQVVRHPYGVPFHPVGHAGRAVDFLHRMDRRRLAFCGDYFSGGYMESALWSAARAAAVHG
jgi:protoporphyrinogen oxidase